MKKSIPSQLLAIILISLVSLTCYAEEDFLDIPVMDDARIFASFTDETPAVINYFSLSTEDEVINFYTDAYGKSISQSRKRGRLTNIFTVENFTVRVIISSQNNQRQIDVMLDERHDDDMLVNDPPLTNDDQSDLDDVNEFQETDTATETLATEELNTTEEIEENQTSEVEVEQEIEDSQDTDEIIEDEVPHEIITPINPESTIN